MKTIKLQLLLLLALVSVNLSAQDIQHFLGTYYVAEMCIDHVSGYEYPEPFEKTIDIKAGVESDLLINIGGSAMWNDFEVFLSGDSLLIPIQWWDNWDSTQASFQGKGKIANDSLFLHYIAGGSFGIMECECKGKKMGVSISEPLPADKNKVYFDSTKQAIVLDGIVQNQSLIFELIDMQGKVILRKTGIINNSSISTTNLLRGVYLYRLIQNGQVINADKLLINY